MAARRLQGVASGGLGGPETRTLTLAGVGAALLLVVVSVCLYCRAKARARARELEEAELRGATGGVDVEAAVQAAPALCTDDVELGEPPTESDPTSSSASPADSTGAPPLMCVPPAPKVRASPRQGGERADRESSRPSRHAPQQPEPLADTHGEAAETREQRPHFDAPPAAGEPRRHRRRRNTQCGGGDTSASRCDPSHLRRSRRERNATDGNAQGRAQESAQESLSAAPNSSTEEKPQSPGAHGRSARLKRQGTSSSFLRGEDYEAVDADLPLAMRHAIDGMRKEIRHERTSHEREGRASRERETGSSDEREARQSRERENQELQSPRPARQATKSSPLREIHPSFKTGGCNARISDAAPSGATPSFIGAHRRVATSAQLSPRVVETPRKQAISPPSAIEQEEMAIFVQAETARRRKAAEDARVSYGAGADYSPPAKLRELRKGEREGLNVDDGLPDAVAACRAERRASRSAGAAGSHAAKRTSSGGSPTGGYRQKRRPSVATRAEHSSQFKREPTSGVQALKERKQREEATRRERENKKVAADRLLAQWAERTQGNVYAMINSAKLFTDLFDSDPLQGTTLQPGNAKALKKAWHRLAARLHPDRQRDNPTATQVLAEEVFKRLSLAYQKENERLGTQ
jgi:hypothetical protein